MITNKDIRVENGNLVLNGDKFPLDGQSPETIMEIVEDNSDTTPTENSTAPITSGGVYTALVTKQDTLTFDNTPTAESINPVTSGGLFNTIGNLSTGATGSSITDQIKFLYNRFYTKKQQNLANAISTTIKLFLCAVVDSDTPSNYSLFIGTLNAAPSIIKENGLAVTFVNSIGTIAETTGATNYTITVFDLAS